MVDEFERLKYLRGQAFLEGVAWDFGWMEWGIKVTFFGKMEEQFFWGGRAVGAGELERNQCGSSGLRGLAAGGSRRRAAADAALLEGIGEEIEQAGILSFQLNAHLAKAIGVVVIEGGQGFEQVGETAAVVVLPAMAAEDRQGELEQEQGGAVLPVGGGGGFEADLVLIGDVEAALGDQAGQADAVFVQMGVEGTIDRFEGAAVVEAAVVTAAGEPRDPSRPPATPQRTRCRLLPIFTKPR